MNHPDLLVIVAVMAVYAIGFVLGRWSRKPEPPEPRRAVVNLNDHVCVTVNASGLKLLEADREIRLQAGDSIRLPLWDVMGVFGSHCKTPTMQPPINPEITLCD